MSEIASANQAKPLPRPRPGCPICSERGFTHLYRDPRYGETENRDIVKCDKCGLAYVTPLLMEHYEVISLKFFEEGIWNGTADYIGNLQRVYSLLEDAIRHLQPQILEIPCGQRHLLDVGTGLGYFLDIARANGWNSIGLEICRAAVEWASRYLGVSIQLKDLESTDLPEGAFHAVTLVEAIEHLEDPLGALGRVRDLLCPGGIVFLSTPNFGTRQRDEVGWKWEAIDPYGHIQYFTMDTMQRLLRNAGFRQVTQRTRGGETNDDTLVAWAVKL